MLNDVKSALTILDQVKEWKILKTLPEKVLELEERISALESTPKSPYPCQSCGSSNNPIIKQESDRALGPVGGIRTTRKCGDCGFETIPTLESPVSS